MLQLDLKNKRILSVLEEDGRAPLSKIAKQVGLSKQLVDYRIKGMLKRGILEGFSIQCDLTKLGYSTFGVYLRLRKLTEQKEKEIIDVLVKHPYSRWVIVCEGKWDLGLALSARNMLEFNSMLENILADLGDNVETYDTNVVYSLHEFYLNFLQKKEPFFTRAVRLEFATQKEIQKIDKIDIKILQQLQTNCRTSLVELAGNLGVSADTVRYRIRNLVSRKIISEFKARINLRALGYNWYQLIIDLRRFTESHEKKIIARIRQIPNLSYVVRCMGKWDFELHINARSNEDFRRILMQIRDALADYIITYDTMIIFKKHKSVSLPDGVARQLLEEIKRNQ